MTDLKPGWTRVKFGEVVRQVKDKVTDASSVGITHYVPGGGVRQHDLRINEWQPVDDGVMGPAFHMRFRQGHTLYKSRVPHGVAVADRTGICANTTFVLEPADDRLLPELLPHILLADGFRQFEKDNDHGSTNLFLNFSDIAQYDFTLPPLEEQRRIASLAHATTKVSEALVAAMSHSEMLVKAARRNMAETAERSTTTRLSLTRVCSITTGKVDSNAATADGAFPFFTCDPEPKRIDTAAFDTDAILLAGNNAQGNFWVKTFKGKFNAYQRTYVLHTLAGIADRDYVAEWLKMSLDFLKARSIGSSTKYLTMGILAEILIAVPSVEAQQDVVAPVIAANSALESLRARLGLANAWRREVLKNALSGNVDT